MAEVLSNTQLLDLLAERLAEKGVSHPDDAGDLFFHEICELLEAE